LFWAHFLMSCRKKPAFAGLRLAALGLPELM
jgi:hypothetical protein